ncbi:porin [Undibacterium sp. Xuan67W]|uniref:porin n=1 Tax=Undibacterium sp. Xuan67W TaxID=3413057 RepID=UPI003BEF9A27
MKTFGEISMKKSLLALAALAAISGAAQAQSNVTIYGVLDMAIQNENNGAAAGAKTALDSGIQSGSRLGFKGTEDLGGGLKAIFKLEMGVNADNGASAQGGLAFGRQAFVGLTGDFGSVTLGRQMKPLFVAVDNIDPFSTGITSGAAGVGTSGYGLAAFYVPTNPRANNTAVYTTNDLSGFTGSASYTFGEVAGDTSNSRQVSLAGAYAAGPLYVTAVYNKENNILGATSTPAVSAKTVFLAGTYDFGVAKAVAAYGKTTVDALSSSTDVKAWTLGATVPVTAADAIMGTYTRMTNDAATANKGSQFALGYTHSLSKRTNLFASISRTANDANSNAGGLAAGNGLTDRLVNAGIRHLF